MNSIINAMAKYDHRQHELSDWLAELEQRFQLGDVETDKAKIIWCQLLIGATGNSILAGLADDTTWETAKETLLSRLGAGSVRDEAWAALKHLTRGTKEIIELAGEAEKLAKRLHPRDDEAAERHAVDAFLGALDRPLAAEVRKLGHTQMEGVVADARRIEKILQEQPPSGAESALETMNRQLQILKKDLLKANDRLAAQTSANPPTVSLAIPAAQTPLLHSLHQPLWQFNSHLRPQLLCRHRWPLHKCHHTGQNTSSHSSTTGRRTLSILDAKTGGRTGGQQGASSVTRKAILPTAVLLDPCCSACSGKLPKSKLGAHLRVKYLNYLQAMVPLKPPQCI